MTTIKDLSATRDLRDLLGKFLHNYYKRYELAELLHHDLDDSEYFKIFTANFPITATNMTKINYDRGRKRLKDIVNLLNKNKLEISKGLYIDIGCDDGVITSVVGQGLGFDLSKIICCDVKNEVKNDLTYIKTDGKTIKLPKESASFITLFQTIHHMEHVGNMMAEVRRICKPDALIFVREHDADDKNRDDHVKLFKLEHQMYDIVMDKMAESTFNEKYYANYYNLLELRELMDRHGFELFDTEYIYKFNPTRYYYSIYRLKK